MSALLQLSKCCLITLLLRKHNTERSVIMGQDFWHEQGQDISTDSSLRPEPTQGAVARHNMALTVVREGTPSQIGCLLRDMEQRGEIYNDDLCDADDGILDEAEVDEEEMDCDLDLADEDDDGTAEDTITEAQVSVPYAGRWGEESLAFDSSQKFELCFYKTGEHMACKVSRDPRCGFFSNSPRAAAILDELTSRYEVLERMGEWIATNRSDFVRTVDLWDFVKDALHEAENKKVSVLQKDFIEIADLDSMFSESSQRKSIAASFSRFIKHTVFSFEDAGMMPVSQLFSTEARCAWVARAFYDTCRISKLDMDKSVKALSAARADMGNRAERGRKTIESMGREEAAALLCQLARVGGAKVVEMYGDKISRNKEV